ncbi:MAG: hypothetical protein ABJC24_03980 [Chloroflexota bacterium]
MSVDRRRAGFRLPWTAEGGEADGEHAAANAKADDVPTPDASAMSAADGSTPDGSTPDGSTPDASIPDASTPDASTTDPASDAPAVVVTAVDAPKDASASLAGPEGESTDFLRSLVSAMRGVAETSRDASLAELRTAIDARLEALSIQAAEMESDLRRRAELDLASVADWERTEIERIRAEAEHKRETRRAKLEQQLSEHRTSSERDAEATRNRLAEHEGDLAAFFAQLSEITDPAAFVAAAKRMPRAPDMTGLSPAATPAGEDPRLAALGGMSPPDAKSPAPEQPTAEPATAATADAATADAAPAETTPAEDGPAAATDGSAENETASPDNRLAERLAQLDERLSGATPVAAAQPTPTNGNGGEGSTAIVVKGLGSFGAITSFKQALERVEGVRGVTLSLGPTGEFVYRASHADEFDLAAAIQGIEGPTATIEDTDGTLVVTLSRAR